MNYLLLVVVISLNQTVGAEPVSVSVHRVADEFVCERAAEFIRKETTNRGNQHHNRVTTWCIPDNGNVPDKLLPPPHSERTPKK